MGIRLPRSLFREDLIASVVVFLVALPLAMGIAIASGVPPALGLITSIIGGIIVGALAGAPLQVSGPAAGLVVIVAQVVRDHGLAALGAVVLLAGAFQIAAGLFRLGQWFRAVSPAVIQGMLAGIGVLIATSQFHVMLDQPPAPSGIGNIVAIPSTIGRAVAPAEGQAHHWAAGIGVLTILVIVLWSWLAPKRLRVVPAALLAVVVAASFAAVFDAPVAFVEVPSDLLEAVTLPTVAVLGEVGWRLLLIEALGLAFIASAETLLCSTATDKMHRGPRTKYDRELWAQGVGNVLCGMLGALPMTGVIVRSSANVQAGAKTRASAMFHGVWLLLLVVLLPHALELIPVSALAAILVYTGYKLINLLAIQRLKAFGAGELVVYATTLVGVVAIDLLSGVLLGLALGAARLLIRLSKLDIDVAYHDHRLDVVFRGSATFLAIPKLAKRLESVPPGSEIHVHFAELDHIDHACIEYLEDFRDVHEGTGGRLIIEWDALLRRSSHASRSKPAGRDAEDGETGEPLPQPS
jgi:MFS superfamily sulfate permease-like transporter